MVVVRLMGGLGNQMFQYALGRHLALKNTTKLYLDASGLHSSKEKNTTQRDCDLLFLDVQAESLNHNQIDFSYTLPGLLKFYAKKLLGIFPYSIVQERGIWDIVVDKLGKYSGWFNFHKKVLSLKSDAYLIGFWQSHRYFDGIADVIRKDFEPNHSMSKQNADFLDSIGSKMTVSIHVRRGDYSDGYHGFCSQEYYEQAIHHMKTQFPHAVFVVFSNDISWCKKQFGEKDFVYVDWNSGADSYRDMILMSKCAHHIIANSSFSWRGAWLNTSPDKVVIAPRQRFQVPLDTSDLIPKGWIRM